MSAVDISNEQVAIRRQPTSLDDALLRAAQARQNLKAEADAPEEYGKCNVSCLDLKSDFGNMSGNQIESLMQSLTEVIKNTPPSEAKKAEADLTTINCANKWLLQCEDTLSGCGKGCNELVRDFQAGGSVPLPVEARNDLFNRAAAKIADEDSPRIENIEALVDMKCLLKYEECLRPSGKSPAIAGSNVATLNPHLRR